MAQKNSVSYYLLKTIKGIAYSLLGVALCFTVAVTVSIAYARYNVPEGLPKVNKDEHFVIDGVQLIDVEQGTVLPDMQLVIAERKIEAIKPAGSPPPANYHVVDGNQYYALPGLVDMHVHVYDRTYLLANLARGVTTVRNMDGKPMHLRWREEINNGDWLGPTLYTSSPIINGAENSHELQVKALTESDAKNLVNEYYQDGYDLIKAYGYLKPEVFDALKSEADKLGIPLAKHAPHPVKGGSIESLKGLQSLEHSEDIFQGPLNYTFDQAKLDAWSEELKQLNGYVTPTLSTFNHLTELSVRKQHFVDTLPINTMDPVHRLLEEEFTIKRWLHASQKQMDWNLEERDYLFKITQNLDEHGVNLLVGSDAGTMYSPAGIATHDEMELMHKAGIANHTILEAATFNAAKALGKEQNIGQIKSGFDADIVLVAENPLENLATLRQPIAVIKQGQYLNDDALATITQRSMEPNNWLASIGNWLDYIIFVL